MSRLWAIAGVVIALESCAPRPFWWEDPNRKRCCADAESCRQVLRQSTAWPTSDGEHMCVSDALHYLNFHTTENLPLARELLASASEHQRWLAANAVRYERGYDEEVAPALAQAWFAHRDAFVFAAMAWNRSPALLPVWLDVLDDPFGWRVSIAVQRLAELGSTAAAVSIDRLAEIAATHWDSEARISAARAHNRLAAGQKRIGPTLDRCPSSVRRRDEPDARWIVRIAQGDVQLRDVTGSGSKLTVHETMRGFEASGQAVAVGQDLLFAYAGLECGGGVEVWRNGKPMGPADVASPVLLERHGDEVLLLESCRDWRLGVLARASDGTWTHRPLASGSGSPVALGVEATGAVDLLIHDDAAWPMAVALPCESPQDTRVPFRLDRGQPFILLRIDRDGSVTVRD